ncbi:MAG: hypothetical protein AB7F23_02475 [Phycisphaerae bacterium]|jgi:hypothetical protein
MILLAHVDVNFITKTKADIPVTLIIHPVRACAIALSQQDDRLFREDDKPESLFVKKKPMPERETR